MKRPANTTWKHLERRPKSSYTQLFIKGRRLPAHTIYGQFVNDEEPRTAEQLAEDYELPLEVVNEAIAYCESNPPEILRDWEMDEADRQQIRSQSNINGY